MTQIYPDSPDEQPLRSSTSPAPLPTPSSPSSHPHPPLKARKKSQGATVASSAADPAPTITPDRTPTSSHAPHAVSSIDMNPISASAPLSYPLPDFQAMSNYPFGGQSFQPPLPNIPTLSSYYQQPQHDEHGQDDFRRHQHSQQGHIPQYGGPQHSYGIPPPRTPQNPGPLSYPATRGYGQPMTYPGQFNSSPPFGQPSYGLNTASSGMPLNQQGFYAPHASPHSQQQYPTQGTPGSALSSPISATYPSALPPTNAVNTPTERHNGKPEKPMCWDHGCNGREFSTFSNLLRHQREKSGNAHKSTCPKCGAVFTRTTARNGHMEHGKCKGRKVEGDTDAWAMAANGGRKE